jgi:hypothetical protein
VWPIHRSVIINRDGGAHRECGPPRNGIEPENTVGMAQRFPHVLRARRDNVAGANIAGFTQVADAVLALWLI